MFRRLLMAVLAYCLLLVGALVLFQERQLYFPDTPPLASVLAEAGLNGLQAWPSENDYRGLLAAPAGPARGTLLLFHGNAGHAGHRAWYGEVLTGLGLRVILAEYPAYGPRPGRLGEAALVGDAVETVARVRRQFSGPLLLAGESLGAGVAAAAYAQAPEEIAGLLLITPWDRLESVARHHFPWLPVGWLLRDRYDSARHLAAARLPVALLIAAQDSVVPARFGQALYEGLPGPKRRWMVPAADHNNWMEHLAAGTWPAMVDFLLGRPEA